MDRRSKPDDLVQEIDLTDSDKVLRRRTMIVTLDGSKLDGTFGGHSTLRSLIDQVRKDFANERLVVSVTVNGERFVEEGLDAAMNACNSD